MKYIDKSIFRYISYLRPTLMAEISGENDIRGIAEFYPLNGGTLILTEVNNLPKTPTNIFAYTKVMLVGKILRALVGISIQQIPLTQRI